MSAANAVYMLIQAVLPGMSERGGGTAVTVSSLAAVRPALLGAPPYGAAKAAVANLMSFVHASFRADGQPQPHLAHAVRKARAQRRRFGVHRLRARPGQFRRHPPHGQGGALRRRLDPVQKVVEYSRA